MAGIDFKACLNDAQLEAVTGPDGPLLVLAAAGTGKTRTLVYRVAYLVERGDDPHGMLLLTFTNRAANEMLERAEALVGPGVGDVWGGTFHHMCNRLLRRHAPLIGYERDYTIMDRDDSRSVVSECVKSRRLQGRDFPKPNVLLGLLGTAVNSELPLSAVVESRLAEADVDTEQVTAVIGDYVKRKRELGAMDFDDLLTNCLRLFREHEGVLREYQQRFRHVLVDEYQDTNAIQAELVDRLAAGHRNLLVVGDDFQSIYAWRGADFRNIMSFPKRYPGARVVTLETNYRSVPEVLDVANACIAGNPDQYQKTLRSTREEHRRPRVAYVRDGDSQARYVVGLIHEMRREGHRYPDIAVLYRAHFHALDLQIELTREGIPYVITSGVRFFEQAHIKDVCSLLRILDNPGDELAFCRLLSLFPGVGPRTAATLWGRLGGRFDAADTAQREMVAKTLRAPARAVWRVLEAVLTAYSDEELQEDGGEIIYRFLRVFYEGHARKSFDNAERRIDDIQELSLHTAKYDSVEQFLSGVALMTNLDAEADTVGVPDGPAVRLSTVHQAKGLEWPVVIVLWATDGMFPSSRSVSESAGGEAEERRLFYVAVTRAKDELCLCVPEVRRTREGGAMYCRPSRFVAELPAGLVENVRPGFV